MNLQLQRISMLHRAVMNVGLLDILEEGTLTNSHQFG
jgi:hypothetical protein